ncbi:unnamed protein product, partial [Rotaria magnacalcarata]
MKSKSNIHKEQNACKAMELVWPAIVNTTTQEASVANVMITALRE